MSDKHFNVLAIGNAIVDIVVLVDDSFLNGLGLTKGTMGLVDSDSSNRLYKKINPITECSGGSAANTITGVTSLGGTGAFIGKVCDDRFGQIFTQDIKSCGVHFETPAGAAELATATSIVFVTPDSERTMQTYLGACVELGPEDINYNDVLAAEVILLEGYLLDSPSGKEVVIKASDLAHNAGRAVSLSLSDRFCVERHRQDFLDLVDKHIDILFANEEEIVSLYQLDTFEKTLTAIKDRCCLFALTRGAKGSVIVQGEDLHLLQAEQIDSIVDTTGAGDAFAAGFLTGYTQGHAVAVAARIGNIAAKEVISHIGARPVTSLQDLVAECLN